MARGGQGPTVQGTTPADAGADVGVGGEAGGVWEGQQEQQEQQQQQQQQQRAEERQAAARRAVKLRKLAAASAAAPEARAAAAAAAGLERRHGLGGAELAAAAAAEGRERRSTGAERAPVERPALELLEIAIEKAGRGHAAAGLEGAEELGLGFAAGLTQPTMAEPGDPS